MESEDHVLKAGYDEHGTVWATTIKDQSSMSETAAPLTIVTTSATHSPTSSRLMDRSFATPLRSSAPLHVPQPISTFMRWVPPTASDYTTQDFLCGEKKSFPLSPNGP